MMLEKISTMVVKYPSKIIILMMFLSGLSCLGFLSMRSPSLAEEFFVSDDSRLVKDFQMAGQLFPSIRSRREKVILRPVAKDDDNVLSRACLKDALLVHKTIVTSDDFQSVCMDSKNERPLQNVSCMMTTPLEVCDFNDKNVGNCLDAIAKARRNLSITLSDGRTFKYNEKLFISGLRSVNDSVEHSNITAEGIRLIYYLKNPSKRDPLRKKILSWEASFLQKMEGLRSKMSCASLYFSSSQDHDTIAILLFSVDRFPIVLTFTVLLFTSVLAVSCTMGTFRPFTVILGLLIAAIVATSFLSLLSISYLASVNIWQSLWILVILMYCKGATDALILIKEVHKQRYMPSIEHRITNCMTKSGLALSTSNLISIAVFGISLMSSFPVFRASSLIALIIFLYHYFAFLILFMACLFLCLKWKYKEISCYPGVHSVADTDPSREHMKEDVSTSSSMVRVYEKIICSKLGCTVTFLLFIGVVACSFYLATRPNQAFDSPLMASPMTEAAKFLNEERKMFENVPRVGIVFYGKLNYSSTDLRQRLKTFGETLNSSSYSQRIESWINPFEEWVKLQNLSCTGLKFDKCLVNFIKEPKNAFFREDLSFNLKNDTLRLVASYFHLYMVPHKEFILRKKDLKKLQRDISDFEENENTEVSVASRLLEETEQLIAVERECIWFAALTGIATTVLVLIFTANPRIALVLAVGFITQVFELVGLLNLWDIPLNYASVICLALGFNISVNFSVQMSQIRALSVDNNLRKRTLDALSSVGTALLSGGILAIMGSIGLGFVFPNLSLIFTRVLPIQFAMGIFHAIGFIPSALLITSKPMEVCINSIASVSPHPQEDIELRGNQRPNQEISPEEYFENSRSSSVAILGISCRFPNAENKELFWDMLTKGKSGFQQDYPANRPSERNDYHMLYHPKRFTPGRLCALGGAYLSSIRDFDAEFFNISPQEAKAMDPQQRILLQTAYEAIEDAGLRLDDLQKGSTGVFVGAMNMDYGSRVMQPENRNNLNQFYSTGVTASILANRISFCLNLTGPSLTVDTACSSSLVALKIAMDCLHNGECDVAIVCAPNIILDPSVQVIFSVGGLLAPDGRCKSFDASGDGYGRGEGFAAVILKLTNDAVLDKDDIYCDIIACGMNNDGQSAVPITAPSAKTQADLSQKVLEQSGLNAQDIEYLEAHGTGTAIGDVVEMKSVAKTYCSNASGRYRVLRVGSVKSNLNHTESASGLAGVIKVSLMLKTKTLVPTVNINALNPKLNLAEKGIKVQDTCEPWLKHDRNPRTAAINSFGYGGSNVHAILQEHLEYQEECIPQNETPQRNHVLTLSAHTEMALHDMAKQHAKWLKGNVDCEKMKCDICWSLNTRRSQHPYRLAVVFKSIQDAATLLDLFAENKTGWEDSLCHGKAKTQHSRAVFVFGGQGTNWTGMGRHLMNSEPLFRRQISEISGRIQELGETWSLENELLWQQDDSNLLENVIGQPATFAIQYATAKLLESWGIVPAAVVGHSLGELAASCVAGALTLEEALKIILVRSKCHERCPKGGCMAALGMSEEDATQLIVQLGLEKSVSIAAVNDGKSVTISGDKMSLESVQSHLQLKNTRVFWKNLTTARAFHSFQVEMVKDCFQSQIKSLHLHQQATTIPQYSTVTGDIVSGKTMDETYWWSNFRQPVQFWKAVQNILRDNYGTFIEISSQPSLGHYIKRIAGQESSPSHSANVMYLPTHPRKSVEDQHKAFLYNTVGRLYTTGYSVDLGRVDGPDIGNARRYIRTPSYPWQKRDHWFKHDEQANLEERCQPKRHAFLPNVKPTESFTGLQCWEVEVDLYQFPTLRDHALLQGGPVLPGSACIEMAIAMTVEKFCCDEIEVKNVQFTNILTLPENQVRLLRLQLQDGKDVGTGTFQVQNIPGDGSEILLARGEVYAVLGEGKMRRKTETGSLGSSERIDGTDNFKDITARMKPVAFTEFRHLTEKYGFNFGPSFSLIKKIWRGNEEAFCIIEIDRKEIKNEMARYIFHPAFLDACFQTSAAVNAEEDEGDEATTFPVRINRMMLLDRNIPQTTFCHVSKHSRGNWVTYNINLMNSQGTILLSVEGFQSTEISTLIRSQKLDNVAYETKWVESAIDVSQLQSTTEAILRIVLKDSQGIGQSFCDSIKRKMPAVHLLTVEVPAENGDWEESVRRGIQSAISSAIMLDKQVQFINFLPIDAGRLAESYEAIDTSQMLSIVSSIQILQAILSGNLRSSHLVLVTRNSLVVTASKETCSFPWATSVLGLRRTASLEHPNIRCTTVDISNDPTDVVLLTEEVEAASKEDEIAFREGKRFVNRITGVDRSLCHTTTPCKLDSSLSLYITLHPKTNDVCFKKNTWPSLSARQIQVNVACTWIADGGTNCLSDCQVVGFSGYVCELEAVTGKTVFQVGDKVCGMASVSKVGNQIQVNADHVIHKPKDMSDPQAANVPACLVGALYVIRKTFGETKNQRLLVDIANSGIGIVTVLVANALGHSVITQQRTEKTICSEVIATLGGGTQTIGIDAAMFFHTPKPTNLQKACQLLKEGGKLIIFKEDENGSITIPAGKKITFERISYTEILQSSNTFEELWIPALQLMQSAGVMNQILTITQATVNVFQKVQEVKGKSPQTILDYSKVTPPAFVSLSFEQNGDLSEKLVDVLIPALDQQGLKADRTYMVVGGMRGFGFEVAKWMCDAGAKTIVLVARSTPSESKRSEVSKLMQSTGTDIILHQADASDSVCMENLEERLKTLPSVAGIVHTAMVLRDELIPNLKTASLREVAAPKIKAAFLLHKMSLKMDLDFFVLFSSIASLLGNPGQASYAAANAFLDGLAQYRRHVLGLPAMSINWGPIKGVGVLQREEAIAEHLSRAGYFLLPSSQAIQYMEKVLIEESGRAQLALFDVDWQKIQMSTPGLEKSTRLAHIRNKQSVADNVQQKQQLAARLLMEKDPRKREEMVREYVSDLLCSWTGNAPSDLDFNSSLYNYGMDSFSGLTFKMQLESSLHISFDVFYFTQPDTTPTRLVQDIIGRLSNDTKEPSRRNGEVLDDDVTVRAEPLLEKNPTQWKETASVSVRPVDEASPTATYHLIPLFKPEQAEVKLFCVHPAGRYAMNLTPICNGFTQQSLVAFYAIGYTEPTMSAENRSVRQMAKSYIRMIKQIQRHGPYYLAGQSFGGLVAYEIANILTEQDEDVAFMAMIDTFPWHLPNRTGAARLELLFNGARLEKLMDGLFEATFEQVLSKLATTNLKMTTDEYKALRETETLENTIAFLQQRATDENVPLYDITLLQDSLRHDNMMATRKHKEWKPPQVRFKGPLTYLKSADQRYTPTRPLQEDSDAAWSLIVDGNIDVYICPGDHLALSEPDDGAVVGAILATAVGLRYRALYPSLPRLPTTFKERRAIHKFEAGIEVLLYSRKVSKTPRMGTIILDIKSYTLTFRNTLQRSDNSNRKTEEKKIFLKGMRNILPGSHEPSLIKIASKVQETTKQRGTVNLMLTTSVVTPKRAYNFQWHSFKDMRDFCDMIEAIMGVTVYKK